MLIEGKWVTGRKRQDEEGRFDRPETTFREWITADGSSGFETETGRYHLYSLQRPPPPALPFSGSRP